MIATFLPHHMQFTLMLSNPVYNASKLQKFSLILPSLDFAEIFTTTHSYYTQHEYCRLLADGKGIFYMECCHSFPLQFWTEDLDPVTLGQSYRTCLHHIFLLTFKSYTPPAIRWNTIWMFCNSIKCSFWPAAITGWWRLWKWFRYHWLTHSIKKDSTHSPCFQHGTCFIWSSSHHTMQYTTNSTQTSAQMLIL